jgi:hypothetical protein
VGTPLAYFLTFTCYGTWLHGDERGSVDDEHNAPGTPVLPSDVARQARERAELAEPPYHLDGPRRQVTLLALCEIAQGKGWALHAAHVRSNHVHLVVTAVGPPERILNDFRTHGTIPNRRCKRTAVIQGTVIQGTAYSAALRARLRCRIRGRYYRDLPYGRSHTAGSFLASSP